MTTPLRIVRDDEKVVRLSEEAATGMTRLIEQQAKEIERLKRHIDTMDRANELMATERDKAQRRADLWQGAAQGYSRKLAEYHQRERTPEQNESLNDAIEQARNL